VAQTLTLLSLSSVAVGLQESTVATVQSGSTTVQLSVVLNPLDLVNPLMVFAVELWRLDDDAVWRLDHGFTFQGKLGLTNQPSMQTEVGCRDGNGNLMTPNLANRQVKARLTNNGNLLSSAVVTLTAT